MKIKYIVAPALFIGSNFVLPSALASPSSEFDLNIKQLEQTAQKSGFGLKVLDVSLNAYIWVHKHHNLGSNKNTLTVVDFALPSYEKRLCAFNSKSNRVLMQTYTTQAKNLGLVYAKDFSNRVNFDKSSLGLFVTSNEYIGHHSRSICINNNARRRNVVIHFA